MNHFNHWSIRARLKTRQLLLLVALAEEGNIHRAARIMRMTQPGASKLLKDLEDALGVSLFERLSRGMRPTWYGETMIRHARMVLANLNQAHDELEALKTGHYGQVSVGAITSPGLSLLPEAVALVKQDYPTLRILVEIETSPVLLDRLEQGNIDIVIGRLFAEHDKGNLAYKPLTEERVSAVTRPGHPLLGGGPLSLRDVQGAGWIVPPSGSVLRHRFDLMFQQEGLVPPINIIETSALLFIGRMLQQSDMVGVLATDVASYYATHGLMALLPLDMPCHMDAFGVITRLDRLLSPGAKVLMKALKQTCQAQYGVALGAD
jgi:DNA-binding transcriptional LysR family regulator